MIKGLWNTRQVFIDNKELSPAKSQSIYNHSPDGFNWGYGGSGPAQLSLGLLLEFTDQEAARRLYQQFKFDVIAGLPQSDFEIENSIVEDWISKQIIKNILSEYQRLSRLCVIARDMELLPEDSFADRLREIEKPNSWDNLTDFFDTVKQAYNKNKWLNQKYYIEVWTEKDALREVFGTITRTYDISLLVVRGQASRTAIYEAYKRYETQNKKCCLLYFGDFDPSGLAIYSSISERLKEMGLTDLEYKRIALTKEDISKYNLPQDPAKQTDPNYKKFVNEYGDNVVELDALRPDILQTKIRESIGQYLDKRKFKQVEKRELKERTETKIIRSIIIPSSPPQP